MLDWSVNDMKLYVVYADKLNGGYVFCDGLETLEAVNREINAFRDMPNVDKKTISYDAYDSVTYEFLEMD
jgi:hypothetical protein